MAWSSAIPSFSHAFGGRRLPGPSRLPPNSQVGLDKIRRFAARAVILTEELLSEALRIGRCARLDHRIADRFGSHRSNRPFGDGDLGPWLRHIPDR